MKDSFFTTRNYVDEQLEAQKLTAFQCEVLLEASVRRLVKVTSARAAAEKLYRLADICAGAEIEPFALLQVEKPTPVTSSAERRHWALRFADTISWSYWTGLAVGFFLGSTWR